jgi:AcrR family transcriptional regulator
MSMPSRPYVSSVRAAAAAEKRKDVVDAAARFLRDAGSIADFSLDAVAKEAGVSRLTVYNQFGSRRGLLEAVFDDIAERGRLARLSDAGSNPDPWRGLDLLVEIFCDFWSGDPALGRLQEAGVIEPEFGQAVFERNERRRPIIRSIVQRILPGRPVALACDSVDLIFVLTGYATFRSLASGRETPAVCSLLKAACRDAAVLRAEDSGARK